MKKTPVVGQTYSPQEQANMHGGSPFQCAPMSGGKVTLLRFRPEWNPEAPGTIQWHTKDDPKLPIIQRQSQETPIPVYLKRADAEWEYMGRFRVGRAVDVGGYYADARGPIYYRIDMEDVS